jgi:hypothetical protein
MDPRFVLSPIPFILAHLSYAENAVVHSHPRKINLSLRHPRFKIHPNRTGISHILTNLPTDIHLPLFRRSKQSRTTSTSSLYVSIFTFTNWLFTYLTDAAVYALFVTSPSTREPQTPTVGVSRPKLPVVLIRGRCCSRVNGMPLAGCLALVVEAFIEMSTSYRYVLPSNRIIPFSNTYSVTRVTATPAPVHNLHNPLQVLTMDLQSAKTQSRESEHHLYPARRMSSVQ